MHLHPRRMFGPDHLDGRSVLVEHLQPFGGHAAGLDQAGIGDKRVMGGRDEQPVMDGIEGTVIARAGAVIGVLGRGHAAEGRRHHRHGRGAEIQRLIIQEGQLFGGGTGLAEIAAIIAHRMLEHAAADAHRHIFG